MVNKKTTLIILIVLVVVGRALLINVNKAEWGDSYRILRASEFIRSFTYPEGEKRPPLFSALLALRPQNVDAVTWSRFYMFAISLLSIYVFYKLSKKFLTTDKQRLLALIFFVLNPVYLYWSLRIYADVPFSLLVLLCFLVFEIWREKNSPRYLLLMGLLCGLGVLTRFEGYILAFSTFFGIIVLSLQNRKNISQAPLFLVAFVLTISPWILYRNPLTSLYLDEPAGRDYSIKTFGIYIASYLFILGIVPALWLLMDRIFKTPKANILRFFRVYPNLTIFIILGSVLSLVWSAALPRLFLPLIPFLIIALVKAVDQYFVDKTINKSRFYAFTFTGIYIVAQYFLKLQFFGSNRAVFATTSILFVLISVAIVLKKYRLFIASSILVLIVLAASAIYAHSNLYGTVKEIAFFSSQKVHGKIMFNDQIGISNWYLNFATPSDSTVGKFKDLSEKKHLTQKYLEENKYDYIIITNEDNPDLEVNLEKRPYLELVKEATSTSGGKMFFTWLVKVRK